MIRIALVSKSVTWQRCHIAAKRRVRILKYTRTVYVYKGEQYKTITEIRRLPDLMNTSIPNNPTDEQLAALGVTREEVMVSLAEAKSIKLNELYGIYELLRDKPTKYKQGDRTFYFDRTAADINKFNSAYSVAQIKGEQGFGVKDEEGNSVWVMLSKSDFESVLLISSNEQTEAYNTFYALRNKVETAETVKDVIAIVWPNIWPESK